MLVIIAITQRRKSTLERAARYNGRTEVIDARRFPDRMNLAGGMAVFIRTYAWVASCHQPPNSRDRSVDLSSSSLVYTATSPFPEPFRYTAAPVSRPKAVPGRSRFTAAKGNRAAFRTVGSLRGANVFAGLGNYSLNFYENGSATFFLTLLTQTPKRPNLFPL